MQKNLTTGKVISLFVAGLFLASGMALAAGMPAGESMIQGSKKSVKFRHDKHVEKGSTCLDCHHKIKGEEKKLKCSTSGCHDNLESKTEPKSLHKVMHSKTAKNQTCLSCHAKVVEKKADKQQKLMGCSDSKCHPAN